MAPLLAGIGHFALIGEIDSLETGLAGSALRDAENLHTLDLQIGEHLRVPGSIGPDPRR